MSVRLDRPFCRAQFKCNLFVDPASNHQSENLPLTRGQRSNMSAQDVQLALELSRSVMPSYRAFNCREQYVGCHRLDQKIFRSGLHRLHDCVDIVAGGNKNNWERRTGFVQTTLELRAAQSGYTDIEKKAA